VPHRIRVANLYQALQTRLQLTLCAGEAGLQRTLLDDALDAERDTIVGSLTYIHPNRIQLIGRSEQTYLQQLTRDKRSQALEQLFQSCTRAVVLVDGVPADDDLCYWAERSSLALFRTPLPDRVVLDNLQHFAALNLSEKITLHGVFLEVLGMGVLLTGDAGIGKSELALELITRGSRLIADDAPQFCRIAPEIISGTCPSLLLGMLEVRGLGVLDIQAMFGDNAIKANKYLRLIVCLQTRQEQPPQRLVTQQATREVLGTRIPCVTLLMAPGRNLAILVEAAVRSHLLKLKGIDTTEQFVQRQHAALQPMDDDAA
jgi:HPr kinase/phosphorylase